MLRTLVFAAGLLSLQAISACKQRASERQPLASASAATSAVPAGAGTLFVIDPASSRVSFQMDSPLEKIRGEALASVQGELTINLHDVEKSSGLVKVDLTRLVLLQARRADEKRDYSPPKQVEQQNKEAREWLQLEAREGVIAAEQAQRNRWPEFRVARLEKASTGSIAALSGAQRNVGATARGEFLLHGRRNEKLAKLELTFEYSGDEVRAVRVKTSEPFKVALEEYDVHPRGKSGKMLKTIGEALAGPLGKQVAQEAPIELEFTATPK